MIIGIFAAVWTHNCPKTCDATNQYHSCDEIVSETGKPCSLLELGGCDCQGCKCGGLFVQGSKKQTHTHSTNFSKTRLPSTSRQKVSMTLWPQHGVPRTRCKDYQPFHSSVRLEGWQTVEDCQKLAIHRAEPWFSFRADKRMCMTSETCHAQTQTRGDWRIYQQPIRETSDFWGSEQSKTVLPTLVKRSKYASTKSNATCVIIITPPHLRQGSELVQKLHNNAPCIERFVSPSHGPKLRIVANSNSSLSAAMKQAFEVPSKSIVIGDELNRLESLILDPGAWDLPNASPATRQKYFSLKLAWGFSTNNFTSNFIRDQKCMPYPIRGLLVTSEFQKLLEEFSKELDATSSCVGGFLSIALVPVNTLDMVLQGLQIHQLKSFMQQQRTVCESNDAALPLKLQAMAAHIPGICRFPDDARAVRLVGKCCSLRAECSDCTRFCRVSSCVDVSNHSQAARYLYRTVSNYDHRLSQLEAKVSSLNDIHESLE